MTARFLLRILLLVFGCGVAASVAGAQMPPPPPAEDFRYKVGVQLVLVPTSVSTPVGTALTDLKQEDFEVLEIVAPADFKTRIVDAPQQQQAAE